MVNVIFVKFGTKYNETHVNRLTDSLSKYYDNIYCYTDDPKGVNCSTINPVKNIRLNGVWNKLALFSPELNRQLLGKKLYLDLDTVINYNPNEAIDWDNRCDNLSVLDCPWKRKMFYAPHSYDVDINSSVMTWTNGQSGIWKHFLSNHDYFMRKYLGIDRFLVHEKAPAIKFKKLPHSLTQSMKYEGLYKQAPISTYEELEFNV